MRIVLDTNVLVSGLLSPFGVCGQIVRMMVAGDFTLCVDARILLEYDEVLKRPKFGMDPDKLDAMMEFIRSASEAHGSAPLQNSLPDHDDDQFLEVAIAAGADALITGNTRHFPASCRAGVSVLSPAQFIEMIKTRRAKKN